MHLWPFVHKEHQGLPSVNTTSPSPVLGDDRHKILFISFMITGVLDSFALESRLPNCIQYKKISALVFKKFPLCNSRV